MLFSAFPLAFKSPHFAAVYSSSGEMLNLFCLKSTLAEALQTLSKILVPETPLMYRFLKPESTPSFFVYPKKTPGAIFGLALAKSTPVSYTHLDVYKRQKLQ